MPGVTCLCKKSFGFGRNKRFYAGHIEADKKIDALGTSEK
jgi:hypothetical protein